MFRRLVVVALGVLLWAPPAAAPAESSIQTPARESGSPINDQGSSYHYRSYVRRVVPNVPGLSVRVIEFADRLELDNSTGQTVTVYGYEGEPYAQVLADGTVRFNTHSPAYYLNQAFYANVTVPPSASVRAAPQWTVVAGGGRLEWHDHRIHWMSPAVPPQVKDQEKRTKIFDWQVPIQVGSRRGAVAGELLWVESGSKAPAGAIAALVAIVVLGLTVVLVVRRRRSSKLVGAGPGAGEPGGTPIHPSKRSGSRWRKEPRLPCRAASVADRPAACCSRSRSRALPCLRPRPRLALMRSCWARLPPPGPRSRHSPNR
jgi:hypothetical protein